MFPSALSEIANLVKLITQPKYKKFLDSQQELIKCNVGNVEKELLDGLTELIEQLKENQFETALGCCTKLEFTISFYKRSIELYMNESVRKLYQIDSQLFVPLNTVEDEEKAVLKWLNIIQSQINDLKERIKTSNQSKIYYRIRKLQSIISLDALALTDFKNTLVALQSCHIIHINDKSVDINAQLFDSMHFHPIVQKSSEKLFKNSHYSQAIFEATKGLVSCVRAKSGLSVTKERDLMFQAFDIKHTDNPMVITKKPVLRLNNLSNISEIDEQEGFCHLFVGVVIGVRNPKAHVEVIQDDPKKTLEYLAFISLLAKRTDESIVNINSTK
jgi:uncharacterized protein (TIGR02391 family)